MLSSHIGSYQENGTYISTTSISARGSELPAWRNTSAAQSLLACGFTSSRPGKLLASDRIAVPCTQATGRVAASPEASSPSTMAQAPSDEGQVSE